MTDEAQAVKPMTDQAMPPDVTARGDEPTSPGGATPDRSDRQKRPRHPARRSRIAAVGIGVAAMVGLVSNMEVSGSRAQAKDPAGSTAKSPARAKLGLPRSRSGKAVASRRPIVLTPHAVVHTVAAPAAGGSGGSGGSGYVAAAAPVAAPAASTGGSR